MTDFTTSLPRRTRKFGVLGLLSRWIMLARSRHALARLDDRTLADIGLTREEAENEAGRPFWDVPNYWTHR